LTNAKRQWAATSICFVKIERLLVMGNTNCFSSIKYWPDISLFWISIFVQYTKTNNNNGIDYCFIHWPITWSIFNPGVELSPVYWVENFVM
jgi:hypothetical protein